MHPDIEDVLAGRRRWALVEGDCLDVLPALPAGAADAVVTDPPFSDVTHDGARTRTKGAESNLLVPFTSMGEEGFLHSCRAWLTASSGWVIAFCDWRHAAAAEKANIPLVRCGIWVKPNSAPQLTGDRPSTGWEAIAIFHRLGRKRWNGGGSRAVWTFNRVDAKHHPCEKPVPLLANLIRLFTAANAIVLDPFAGSGTTGVACLQTGRRFIGVEISTEYAAIARKRLEAAERDQRDSLFPAADFEPEPVVQGCLFAEDDQQQS